MTTTPTPAPSTVATAKRAGRLTRAERRVADAKTKRWSSRFRSVPARQLYEGAR